MEDKGCCRAGAKSLVADTDEAGKLFKARIAFEDKRSWLVDVPFTRCVFSIGGIRVQSGCVEHGLICTSAQRKGCGSHYSVWKSLDLSDMGSTETEADSLPKDLGATSTVDASGMANFTYRGYAPPMQYPFDTSWSTGVSSQVPMDPNFVGLGGLGSAPGDQQFMADPVLAGLPPGYAPIPPFFMPPGDSNFAWNDPVMASLFPESFQQFSGLDGTSGSADALGTAGGVPLPTSSIVPPLLNGGVTGLEGVGDLEQSFAALGGGTLGAPLPATGSTPTAGTQFDANGLDSQSRPVTTSSTTSTSGPSSSGGPPKPQSWAAVAGSAPKKRPQPAPVTTTATTQQPVGTRPAPMDHQYAQHAPVQQQQQQQQQQQPPQPQQQQPAHSSSGAPAWPRQSGATGAAPSGGQPPMNRPPRQRGRGAQSEAAQASSIGLDAIGGLASHGPAEKLRAANEYNPKDIRVINMKSARFFVIKSYSEDDIHRSIKYSIWTSTEHGNKHLDSAYREQKGKPVYLLFSVNGSGHFCGCAEMRSEVDYTTSTGIWSQEKWKGKFDVKWIYVKDVPNSHLRHIRLENNENKPVTNSRDTQEVPLEKARLVMKIMHNYQHQTSIFDDFGHYEKRQEHDSSRKTQRKS